jgi:nucleoside phosphorylase-like protein
MRIDYVILANKNIADILIVTATETETRMLHSAMEAVCEDGLLEIVKDDHIYYAGLFGGYNVIHCQCTNMGTQEKGSSTLTTAMALSLWTSVKAVVMVGIAFGMYENEGSNPQHFSDVLIASKIFPYENQRLNKDGSVKYRGKEHRSSEDFLDAFAVIGREWQRNNLAGEATSIEIAPLLTGEKLVDNLERRNELKQAYPEYRGGEMEGMGIVAACEEHGKPWVLLKAICDFGDGNKSVDETEKQQKQDDAASAAVEACAKALRTVNVSAIIGVDRINFYYRSPVIDLSKVFFMHYDSKCAPYYLERSVDRDLYPIILTKSCWVYGNSGMGKSELLIRTLTMHEVEYVYVDLALCSKTDVMEAFDTIYVTLCEVTDTDVTNINEYADYVKAICKVLNNQFRGKKLYLLIDEIPFDYKSSFFFEFVEKFTSMLNYFSRNVNLANVLFLLSSIASPLEAFERLEHQQKITQFVRFLELKDWTPDECCQLIALLSRAVCLDWTSYGIDLFAEKLRYSPRLIKNALKEICSLGYGRINEIVVNQITVG